MGWNSVRVRLTLWNVAVVALILAGFGATLAYGVQAELNRSADRDLAARAQGMAERWARFSEFSTSTRTRMWEQWRDRSSGQPGASRAFTGPPAPGPSTPPTSEAERLSYFRRSRMLDLKGRSIPPFRGEAWDPLAFALAAAGKENYSNVLVDGEPLRIYSLPLRRAGTIAGVVQTPHSLADQRRLSDGQLRTLLTLIPVALLVAGLGGMFLTERALRPIRRITQAAAEISAQDLSRRLEVSGRDELSALAATFNGMIGRLDDAFRTLEAAYEHLETAYEQQRRFTADASHELRTPLARIKAHTSLALSRERSAAEYRQSLEVADHTADLMNRIVQDLLLLARSDAGQLGLRPERIAIDALLSQAAAEAGPGIAGHVSASVRVEPPAAGLCIVGDRDHLLRLLVNLVENALRHTPPDGRIIVSAHTAGDEVALRVEDTGEGIPAEHIDHVCERFYRADDARSRQQGGTGLGLAICQSIAQAHGGRLTVESELGQGTCVTAWLPRPEPAARAGAEPALAMA